MIKLIFLTGLLAATAVFAQTTGDSGNNGAPNGTPASGAASTNADPSGDTVSTSGAQDTGEKEYQGPTILSRIKPSLGERGGRLLDFRPYAEITGVFDDGLTAAGLTPQGLPAAVGTQAGYMVGFGVIGARHWRHDQLNAEYRGNYTDYRPNTFFNGLSQYLGLDWSHQFSGHLGLDVRENAGVVPFSFGQLSYIPLQNPDLFGVPTNDLFDNPVYFSQTGADLAWQKTARLSFSVGGDFFLVRRRAAQLAGLNGTTGRGDIAYRLSKRTTVGLNYNFTTFDYTHAFGNAYAHSLSVAYSVLIGRNWTFSVLAGGFRIQSLELLRVPIDPAIAAIVGYNYTTVVGNPTVYAPLIQSDLTRRFQRASLSFTFARTISPGNGVYLVSRTEMANVGFSYSGFRRFSLGGFGGYNDLSAVSQQIGKYRNFYGGFGSTYRLAALVFATLRYDYRHYTVANALLGSSFLKNENRVSLGLAFSPGFKPLAIW